MRFGQIGSCYGVSFAREAARPGANPMGRPLTRDIARSPLNMHVGGAANAQGIGLSCGFSGKRASPWVCACPGYV